MLLLLAVSLLGIAPAQDDAEAKKKRLGELFTQMNKAQIEMERLIQELTGGDREKRDALMAELMEKFAPEMAAGLKSAQTASRERNASASLKTLATAEADFRANDRDLNRANDFWVADVSGLWRVEAQGDAIRLIEMAVGAADAKPAVVMDKAGPLPQDSKTKLALLGKAMPKNGYLFAAVEKYVDENGKAAKYDEGNGRNPSRFAFCAFPAEYGKTGKMTFLIDENNTVMRKDTGGKAVELFPADPRKDAWQRME